MVGDTQVKSVSEVRNLGVSFDSNFQFRSYINSRIDYCNAILHGSPAIHVNRLRRVQNAAARLLTNTLRYSS